MKATFLAGNAVMLLETGSAYFPALLAALDSATVEIYLESYIFADDDTGRAVSGALGRAAQRGVVVRVLVDGFGARMFPDGLGRGLVAQGVEVQVYRPEVARLSVRRHRLRRLHRKLVVVDGRIAFVGGINVIDDMDTPGQVPPRFDYAVQVTGPLLPLIHHATRHLWLLVRWTNFHRHDPAPRPRLGARPTGGVQAAFVLRDNLRHRRDIEDAYLEAIGAAQQEIILASAYFFPGIRFRHALMDAARRGVRVVILLQGRVEYMLLHYATQALHGNLIAAGVSIVEYRRSFLHAKVAVIDGYWATVGSSNIDPFSLLLAREANIVVRHTGFAGQLRESLHRAMAEGGAVVDSDDLKNRPLYVRIASWLAYAAVRMAVGIAGYGAKQFRT
jgi:cardiolipin synthase